MATLGTFVSGQVLTAAELNAIGTWQDFTPTLSFGSVGNGTIEGQYCQLNDLVVIHFYFLLGSTSSISTGFSFTPPVDCDTTSSRQYFGGASFLNASTGNEYGGFANAFASNRIRPIAAQSDTSQGSMSATFPFTWATGDEVVLWGTYRAS